MKPWIMLTRGENVQKYLSLVPAVLELEEFHFDSLTDYSWFFCSAIYTYVSSFHLQEELILCSK